MQRKSEWLGIGAVILFVVGLLAYQYLPSNNDLSEGVTRVDATDFSIESASESDADSTNTDAEAINGENDASGVDTVIVYDWIIHVDDLPDEAWDTLYLIDTDGPYPYSKDGSTFQNREGLLPDHQGGHYREFTVDTPGSSDRGARRIVTGADGEMYWTDDHYGSFAQIVGW